MQSYEEADAVLTGRCRERRKVANNTWAERRGDDIAIRLHDTDVVTYHPDGSITLNTGGWFTVTTKERMSRFTDFSVHSVKGEWFVQTRNPDYVNLPYDPDNSPNPDQQPYWLNDEVPFRDGMTWTGNGWTGVATPEELETERAERAATRKAIRKFIKSITPADVVRQLEQPGRDCFMCRFESTNCLATHVEERYFHSTLAYRAVKARGYFSPDVIMSMIYHDAKRGVVSKDLTDNLRKFLNKHLLEGVATK